MFTCVTVIMLCVAHSGEGSVNQLERTFDNLEDPPEDARNEPAYHSRRIP